MLQTMRNNAQGTLAKIIVAFIIIVFALWGVESIVTMGGGEPAAIEVDGVEIKESDIAMAMEMQRANLSRQFGDQFNEDIFNEQFLRQAAVEQLISEKISLNQANKLGLAASSRMVDEVIVSVPVFQNGGRFDRDQYVEVLRMNGMSPLQYRQALASDIIVNQSQAAFALSGFATPFSAKLKTALDAEERTFEYVELDAKEFVKQVSLSEDEIEQAYNSSLERFAVPEMVSVKYVEVKRADLAATLDVSDAELNNAYEDYKLRASANEQRQASHILLETFDRSLKEAKELAAELKTRIDQGESFEALAKEYSDDLGSKEAGGDLGITLRGSFDELFENALYSLAEGEVSEPVETDFGIHLIRATKVIADDLESFEEMKDTLAAEVRESKAYDLYEAKIIELSDLAFSALSIDEAAKTAGLTLKTTPLFERDSGEGIAESESVREASFAGNVLYDNEISSVIELADSALVLAINEHKPESVLPLSDVRDSVVEELTFARSLELAKERADAISKGDDENVKWNAVTTTFSQNTDADRMVQQRAFSIKPGEVKSVAIQGGYAVVKLNAIDKTNWADVEVDNEQLAAEREANSRKSLLSFQAWSRDNSKIKQN